MANKARPGSKVTPPPAVATPRSLATAVQAALLRTADLPPAADAARIDLVADALVAKACAGDVQAIKAVFERIDGKVTAEQAPDVPRVIKILHTFKSSI